VQFLTMETLRLHRGGFDACPLGLREGVFRRLACSPWLAALQASGGDWKRFWYGKRSI